LYDNNGAVWEELLRTVQPGWEEDYDYNARRLDPKEETQQQDHQTHIPFPLTQESKGRLLQHNSSTCQEEMEAFYTLSSLTQETRLWPVWKTSSKSTTILDPQVIQDICLAEQETQRHLEEEGLCFGCSGNTNDCFQPYSIVFYAREVVEKGMELTCQELAEAWAPYQASTEEKWKGCVQDIREAYNPSEELEIPDSCPSGFLPTLVEGSFDETSISRYTASIFATSWDNVDGLYEQVKGFDRASSSSLVHGVYDTQYEDFINLYLEEIMYQDMILAMGSAVVVSVAIIIHTRSPFLAAIGLVQIILSFPLSYLVYKMLAGLEFFPFLNFIGIFIVFALGAGAYMLGNYWMMMTMIAMGVFLTHLLPLF
jgi:hypothetical protein